MAFTFVAANTLLLLTILTVHRSHVNAQLDIIEVPANTQAQIGDTVTFNCSMAWEPAPTLTWSSNSSARITPSAEMTRGAATFSQITINSVQISDYQYYTCLGVAAIDSDSRTAALGVLRGIEATSAVTAFPGDSVTLNCTIRGFPAPTVEWVGGRFEGPVPSDNVITLDAVRAVYQLTFPSIGTAETGQLYSCVASNLFGNIMLPPSRIDEGMHPSIREELQNIVAVVGDSVSFTCVANGNPTPTITWSSNSNANIESFAETLIPGTHTSTIALTNISSSDLNQWYTCTATNEFGRLASSSAFLSEAVLPIIVQPPMTTAVILDIEVDLFCTATGNPAPNITWNYANTENLDISATMLNSTSRLNIPIAEFGDFQSYNCTATNFLGSDSALALVGGIIETPSRMETNYFAVGQELNITCAIRPTDLPVVWHKRVVTGTDERYVEVSSVDPRVSFESTVSPPTLRISNVTFGDGGTYRCSGATPPFDILNATFDVLITPDTIGITVLSTDDDEALLSMNSSVHLISSSGPTCITCFAFGEDADPQINFSSFNLTSSGRPGFLVDTSPTQSSSVLITNFPSSLNGFFICSSGVSRNEERIFVANATLAGGAAIALTSSPLSIVVGDKAVITYLIVLVDDTLNVTTSIVVDYDFDGPLPEPVVYDRGSNVFDVVFGGLNRPAFFNVDLFFGRNRLTTNSVEVIVESLRVETVEESPQPQTIFEGQNVVFECLLTANNGQLAAAQWRTQMVDAPSNTINMNTSQYYILPPANSVLVIVNASMSLSGVTVWCSALDGTWNAPLTVQSLPDDCSVDNRNCEELCDTSLSPVCGCPNGQMLVQTSCISRPIYFIIYGEVYEDTDVFIHHRFYHFGPFEITCHTLSNTAGGMWIIDVLGNRIVVPIDGGNVTLSGSDVRITTVLRGTNQAVLVASQPIDGRFTCEPSGTSLSQSIRTITGGGPLLELVTPLPVYFLQSQNLTMVISAHYVNGFGKTVRANQPDLNVFLVEVVDGNTLTIADYDPRTGRLDIFLPRSFPTDFSSPERYVHIFLRSTDIRISPVYADIMESPRDRSVTTPGDLVLTCFTVPSNLPIEWIHWKDLTRTEKLLSDDPRTTILPISNGSMLTLRNSTPEDSGVIFCRFNIELSSMIAPILGEEATFDVLIIPDVFSFVVLSHTTPLGEPPIRTGYPVDGSIHVIPSSENSEFAMDLQCYNLNNGSDTEITFANSELAEDDSFYSFNVFNIYSQASFPEFPVRLNGNVTCRSRSTGQEITVFIANATLPDIYVMPVSRSPIYTSVGSTVLYSYRIGLVDSRLDVQTSVRVNTSMAADSMLLDQGNGFYDVQLSDVQPDLNGLEFFLEFNGVQVSPSVTVFVSTIPITPKPAKYAAGRVGEDITISCIPDGNGVVINWQKDAVQIVADNSKYMFSPAVVNHMLTIKSVTISDAGSYTCSTGGATIAIEVIVINEEVAFFSNGVELPQLAVYNEELLQSFTLICAGGEGSRDLQIEIGHAELPRPVPHGVHFTTDGPTITIREFDDVIEVGISMANLTNSLGMACRSQQSQALARYLLTTDDPFVYAVEESIQAAYSSSVTIQFIVALDSNGSRSILTNLTDYSIERLNNAGITVETYSSLDIDVISDYTFQLVIPRAETVHSGRYMFIAEILESITANTVVEIISPNTTINESTIYELVGQTVELFCVILFPGVETFPDSLFNFTVEWYRDDNVTAMTTVVGSSVHTLVLDSVSSSAVYTCAVSGFLEGNEVQLNILPSPVNIGYDVNNIIPSDNVINFIVFFGSSRREGEEEPPFILTVLSCYTTRGFENPEWQLPVNGSAAFIVSIVSVYETQLIINPSLFPVDFIDRVTCLSSNGFVNSSIIITIQNPYIELLVPDPLSVMYARNTSITIRIVWNSNGILNMLQDYIVQHISTTGQFISAPMFNVTDTSQQIFDFPLGPASTATAGTYTTITLSRSIPVVVTVEVPTLTVSEERVVVVVGEDVTVQCLPSDISYIIEWEYSGFRNSISIPPMGGDPQVLSRLQYESPYHQVSLRNVTLSDNGILYCFVPPVGKDPRTISKIIPLHVFEKPVVIGLTQSEIIPENNVVNIRTSGRKRGVPVDQVTVVCFTTQGYENPVWMMSTGDFSSGVISDGGDMITLPDGSTVSTTVIQGSLYESRITIFTPGINITSNLVCKSQNNPGLQYSITITTSPIYFQSMPPSPIMLEYNILAPIMLRIAIESDNGIDNNIGEEGILAIHIDSIDIDSIDEFVLRNDGGSSQLFTLDLGLIGSHRIGNYFVEYPGGIIGTLEVNVNLPTITTTNNIEALSGQTVTLECLPSNRDLVLIWRYETTNGFIGEISADSEDPSQQFSIPSSNHHQIIIYVTDLIDTGNYTCIIQSPPGDSLIINQTISLSVGPACGRESDDRFSYGVLWPITKVGSVAEVFCTDINPSFGFGPYATRNCTNNDVWGRVDTSQCSIRPTGESNIVVYSDFITVNDSNVTSIPEIDMLLEVFNGSQSVSVEFEILSNRVFVQNRNNNFKRQAQTVTELSVLAPYRISIQLLNNDTSLENVSQTIQNVFNQSGEIIGFNSVDICLCSPTSETANVNDDMLTTVDICVGASVNPCVCTDSGCMCNGEGYTGDGTLCARDSDRDSFPDIGLNCTLSSCTQDQCPFIATDDGQDDTPCLTMQSSENDNVIRCFTETDTVYGIAWPTSLANTNATNSCPRGLGTAVRPCNSTGGWEAPIVTNCSSYEYRALIGIMMEIAEAATSESTISTLDVNHLTTNLAIVSNRTEEGTSEYPTDLVNANILVEFSINMIEEDPAILDSPETVQSIVDCFSNLLSPTNDDGWTQLEEMESNQSQVFLFNAERFGIALAGSLEEVGTPRTVEAENIVIRAELTRTDNVQDVRFPDASQIDSPASVLIPAGFIIERSSITGINPVPIVNVQYENLENILPLNIASTSVTQPISRLVSSQVTNVSAISVDYFIQLSFQYSTGDLDIVSDVRCGFWNFSANDGRGGWDSTGVTTVSVTNDTITCNSSHLTSFAVLVDVAGGHGTISEAEQRALSIVSYIGCGISIVCLLIVIAVLLFYSRTLMKGIHNFIHLNLSIALLLALIVFVSGIETAKKSEVGCKVVAALLHYLFTCVFTWMLCEGIMLYFLLVKVFNTGLGQRKLFYLAIGWGVPIPIVGIAAGVAHEQYGHEDFCWIHTGGEAIWGFVAPMIVVIIANVFFLILSLRSLYQSRKQKMEMQDMNNVDIVKTVLKATVILLPLLGITWVFGVLAVNQESSVFAWIFTVLNSLQGFFILIFHVVRNETIWKKLTACWDKKSKYHFVGSSKQNLSGSTEKIKSGKTASTGTPYTSKYDNSALHEASVGVSERDSVVEMTQSKPADPSEHEQEEAVTTTTFSRSTRVDESNL